MAHWAAHPNWVTEISPDLSGPIDPDATHDGTYSLLEDTRIRLGPKGVERYCRRVRKAVNQAGVAALGEIEIEYAPEHQHLYLHRAALIRDGKVIDETGRASLRMIEQERESENRVYSGSISALLVLSDVRPGDIVDVAYSLDGSNPILNGRFAGHVLLGADTQVRRVHVEVSSAAGRPTLHWAVRGAAPPPTDAEFAGQRVLTWDLKEVRPEPQDDRIPANFSVPARLELSEFANWAEVAEWAVRLYPAAPHPTLTAKANELRASAPDLKAAVLAAVRFVQDDVRYLSVSLGPHSVQPHTPISIFGQRFGDCKDKSYLLVELLRALGVEAHAALADSDLRAHLRDSLPSPFAFDHVVTQIVLGGAHYWIDATWSHQGGRLEHVAPPDVGAALVIAPETTDLADVPIPAGVEPSRSAVSEYSVGPKGDAKLNVTTTYLSESADFMRSELASKSTADISREYVNFYAKDFPGIDLATPLEVRDARDDDAITTTESYTIPEFWRDDKRTLVPDLIWMYLTAPSVTRRETPLSLSHPIWIRETQRIALPFSLTHDTNDKTLTDAAATVKRSVEFDDHLVIMTHEYRSLADEVPLAGLPHHLQFLTQARQDVGIDLDNENSTVSDPSASATDTPSPSPETKNAKANWWPVMELGAVLSVGGVFVWRFARLGVRRKKFRKQRDGERGDLPVNAQSVASIAAAESAFTRDRCECGAAFDVATIEFTTLLFRDRLLHAARAQCPSCHELRRAYFELPAEEARLL